MTATPPPVHVPRPYALPQTALAARVEVPTEDGATIVAWTYAPDGVVDEPETPFGLGLAVPPVLMLHGNGEEHGIFGPVIDAVCASGRAVIAVDSRAQGASSRGTAPLSSSVLMGVLPAKAAGVERIVLATPAKNGVVAPLTLVAAKECGVSEVYKMGGAQAIAALAYGTQSVGKVDVIAGPGNIYVTLAKKEVYGEVGIDMLAGPSEILIIADGSATPRYVAADVLSQAEHDVLARAILVTPSEALACAVKEEVERQLELLPRREIVRQSVEQSGGIIVVRDLAEACELANAVAPEHLEICTEQPEALLPSIRHAGAVFLGHYTPEPVGDYFAGPNHILPTSGSAKFFQVLNEDTFTRKMSVISYTKEALFADGADIVRLARSEELDAHANAVAIRMEEER